MTIDEWKNTLKMRIRAGLAEEELDVVIKACCEISEGEPNSLNDNELGLLEQLGHLTPKLEKAVQEASGLLAAYLVEFPEHDQGDFRVWKAREILEGAILTRKPKGTK